MEEVRGFVSAKDALAALEQYQGCFFPHSAAVKIINQLSREDVEPVVRARWLAQVYDPNELPRYKCSNCLEFVQAGDDRNYCPTCGSKMDGGTEDGN